MGPDYSSCLFSKSNTPYQSRDDNKLIQPLKRTTTFGIKSVAYFGTHLWNMLPNHIKNSVSLYDFKSLIRKWSDPTCCCSVCTQVVWSRFCRYKSIYYGIWLYHFTRVYIWENTVTCSFYIYYTHLFSFTQVFYFYYFFVTYSPDIIRFNWKLFIPFLMYCIVIVYMLYIVYIIIIMVGD